MNDTWRTVKRGNFGWYVEGKQDIKAFWLPEVVLMNPDSVHGEIAPATADLLRQRVAEHASEVRPHPKNFEPALLVGGFFKAFRVSETLGGGYMVVLPASWKDFHTIGFERPPKRAWQFWK